MSVAPPPTREEASYRPSVDSRPFFIETRSTSPARYCAGDVDLGDLGPALATEPALVALVARRVGRVLERRTKITSPRS